MSTVPPAPGFFNGYDENDLGSPQTRTTPLPDELSIVGSQMAHADEDQPLLDDEMQIALAEMVDDAAIQRADELLGTEIDAAARMLASLFPHEAYIHVCRSFGTRLLSGCRQQYVNYAAWVGDTLELGSTPGEAARKVARRLRGPSGQGTSPGAGAAAV